MDQEQFRQVEQIFFAAIDLDPSARDAFLERACAGDTSLRGEVEALLDASARSAEYFDKLPDRLGIANLLSGGGDEHVGTVRTVGEVGQQFGQYRLTEPVGSGGMGTVWRAERSDGRFEGEVAVKLLAQSGGGAALERFALEGRYLAKLAHPNIARLLDAGVGPGQQPYLILEYVPGLPIDRYCDDRALSVNSRIHLFLQVLDAVTHAHAHLIVHRDVKPSNVQVASDGSVKLLDFGVAKLLGDEAPQGGAALTRQLGAALTPEYAAPEQLNGETITTATDVYSLGLLLSFLLTGVNPRDTTKLQSLAELRALAQKEPTRLFDTVTSSPYGEQLGKLARERNTSSSDFLKVLRGDLDNIVRKALAVEPDERYETVADFAQDLRRYLRHEPVAAQAPTIRYRAQKFVRRHRGGVLAASLTLLVLIASVAITTWQSVEATRQRDAAIAERQRADEINAFITSIFQQTDPYQAGVALDAAQLLHRALEDLEQRFLDRPDHRLELLSIVGSSLISQGDLPGAEEALQEALASAQREFGGDHVQALRARALLTEIHSIRRDTAAVRSELAELLPAARAQVARHPEILVRLLKLQADLAFEQGRYTEVATPAREATEIARRQLDRGDPLTSAVSALLAESLVVYNESTTEMLAESERALEDVLATHPNPDHPQVLRTREIHSRALAVAGLFRESVEEARAVIDAFSRIFGAQSLPAVRAMANIAPYERRLGEIDESLRHSDSVLQVLGQTIEHQSGDFAFALTTRGVTFIAARRADAALVDLARAEAAYAEAFGDRHWDVVTAALNRAVALAYLGRFAEARDALVRADDPGVVPRAPWWVAHVGGIAARLEGRYEAAIAAQHEAERLIPSSPRADWDRVRALPERGLAELAAGSVSEARATLSEAQELFIRLQIDMHPAYAETLVGLGASLVDTEPDAALPLLEQANDFWRTRDPGNPNAGEAAFWLGRCYLAMNRDAEASSSFSRAAQLLSRSALPRDAQLSALIRDMR